MPFPRFLPAAVVAMLLATPAASQQAEVPYWATLRAKEAYMRVGPSQQFPIEWVYRRPGLPVKVVRVMQGWRLVEDPDGEQGWILRSLLDPDRGAIVIGEGPTEMRNDASASAPLLWKVEPGVVGKLGECKAGWCRLDIGGRKGWLREERLWGAGEP